MSSGLPGGGEAEGKGKGSSFPARERRASSEKRSSEKRGGVFDLLGPTNASSALGPGTDRPTPSHVSGHAHSLSPSSDAGSGTAPGFRPYRTTAPAATPAPVAMTASGTAGTAGTGTAMDPASWPSLNSKTSSRSTLSSLASLPKLPLSPSSGGRSKSMLS